MAGSSGEPPDAQDRPDPDDFEQRISEIEAELRRPAKFKEPSAAERASKPGLRDARKARKLRKPVPEPAPAAAPEHWRSGPGQPRRTSPGRGRAWSLLIAVVVIAGLAAAGIELPKLALHKTPAVAAHRTQTTPASRPTTAAGASFLPSPTVAAPFLGTPAQSYADGSAGIVIPPAHGVGSYSAGQVAAAYRTTRKLLVAADLNTVTLGGGTPHAFARLLVSRQRMQFLAGLNKTGYNAQGGIRSTRTWVIAFAPGTELVGTVIKVHGTMQASDYADDGSAVLRIQVNYLIVYAVMEPGVPSSLMRVVVHDEGPVSFATWDDPGGPLEPWWQMVNTVAGIKCGATDGYVHPQFPVNAPGKVKPTGSPVNPYDQSAPLYSGCRNTTGT
jgi:hypothetical protein